MILQFSGVSKSFGSQNVLRDAGFQVNQSEKTGLIGANGAGKTTLLKLIAGSCEPDAGSITRKSGLQIGVLDQIPDFHETTTVFEEALRSSDYLRRLESEMRDLEHAIATETNPGLLDRYSHIQHEFELKGGYSYRARTEAALQGVGFSKQAFDRQSHSLSGGEKNRLALAKLLLSNSELLLLDEPTNHLDIRSIEWLEDFLKDTDKTLVVVSHDRVFLDRVVNHIVAIENGEVRHYQGNYSDSVRQRAEWRARQEKEWQLQSEWIEQQEDYIRRNIAGQKTKQAQSRRKLLARVKRIEKPLSAPANVKFRFMPVDRTARSILTARNLAIGYQEKPLVRSIQFEVERGERWAILGPNGSGKTTLLRTLIGERTPLDGELDWSEAIDIGYYDQQLQDLDPQATIFDEIRDLDPAATDGELRSYLGQFLFSGEDVFKKVAQLSGGEKSRLSLARLIYASPQLLALDEPTNHLDIASREALESALMEFPGTILFVTHDRYLVQKIATRLVYVDSGRAHVFDRLSAFEEWLNQDPIEAVQPSPAKRTVVQTDAVPPQERPVLSKNRREQLEREIVELENSIQSIESEIAGMELLFQEPPAGADWQAMHRRYAELKTTRDGLYDDLASRWDRMS